MQSLVRVYGFSSVAYSQILVKPPTKTNFFPLKYHPNNHFIRSGKNLRNKCRVVAQNNGKKVSNNEIDKDQYIISAREGESLKIIPKHVAIILDGNRRWLKSRGLDLDYKRFFKANMRFVEYCLKWGVGTGTSYIYGLGNVNKRTKEATDLLFGQFETFLEEELEYFMRKGVRVLVVGETYILSESCQATIKKVEEATKNNKKFDFILPMCYTSQRDIVQATRAVCKKVKEGSIALEDVNEDMIELHLALGGSRFRPDLLLRTGGDIRIGMLLGWQVAHVELYFTNIQAPDFKEDDFLNALLSYQQRERMFGK